MPAPASATATARCETRWSRASAEPAEVVAGLLALHPFRTLYIADLDAIRKQGDHKAAIFALRQAFPELALWVDAGFAGECSCRRFLGRAWAISCWAAKARPTCGCSSCSAGEPRLILSLDFQGDRPLGAAGIFATPERWPERVIAMTLARVGTGGGPDLDRLRALRRHGARQAALCRRRGARARRSARLQDVRLCRRAGRQRAARWPARPGGAGRAGLGAAQQIQVVVAIRGRGSSQSFEPRQCRRLAHALDVAGHHATQQMRAAAWVPGPPGPAWRTARSG